MARLNIDYDLLTWEGDILRLQFWAHAFEILKQQGAVYLQTEGRLAGCWVMTIDDGEPARAGERGESDEPGERATRTKSARRSSSARTARSPTSARTSPTSSGSSACSAATSTTGRSARASTARTLWATTSDPAADAPRHPPFGGAARDLQRHRRAAVVPAEAAEAGAGRDGLRRARRSARSTSRTRWWRCRTPTARELGYEPSAEDAKKPFVEVSGRKGLGVKADDLLDRLDRHGAGGSRAAQSRAVAPTMRQRIGRADRASPRCATSWSSTRAARSSRSTSTRRSASRARAGPYLQYAVVRANNIFAKLQERDGVDEDGGASRSSPTRSRRRARTATEGDELWALVLEAARLDEIVEQVVRIARVLGARQVRVRAGAGVQRVLSPRADPQRGAARRPRSGARPASAYVRAQLTRALDLMGIAVPARM